jgi:hypothetical protein
MQYKPVESKDTIHVANAALDVYRECLEGRKVAIMAMVGYFAVALGAFYRLDAGVGVALVLMVITGFFLVKFHNKSARLKNQYGLP